MENGSSLWLVRQIFILAIAAIALLFVLAIGLKRAFEAKIEKNRYKMRYNIFPIGCIAIVLLSWKLNFGFIMLGLIMRALPLIHMLIFAIINLKAATKADNNKNLRRLLVSMYITFTAAYVFMPDIAEGGVNYVFFGLIKEQETVLDLCNTLYPAFFTANIIFMAATGIVSITAKEKFALQKNRKSDYIRKMKKNKKGNNHGKN